MGTSSKLYTLNNAIFCLDKGVHFRLSLPEPLPQLNNHHVSKYHVKPCLNFRSFHIVRLCHLDLTGQANQLSVSRARRLFCQLAVGKMGYPGAEVARFLGVTTSVVVRAAKTEELKKVQKYP